MEHLHFDFDGSLGPYKILTTLDGSQTVWSEHYQEACHSLSGANAETDLYYIKGCRIGARASLFSTISILDVGFGMGVSYNRTIQELFLKAPHAYLHYLAVEIDEGLVKWVIKNSEIEQIKRLKRNLWGEIPCYEAKSDRGPLQILIGNARETMMKFKQAQLNQDQQKFHAIYQDAFSPLKNPELWTREWFSLLKNLSHPECILATFSGASRIKKSLIAAGWKVHPGPFFGRKTRSTYALLQGESDTELLQILSRSPVEMLTD